MVSKQVQIHWLFVSNSLYLFLKLVQMDIHTNKGLFASSAAGCRAHPVYVLGLPCPGSIQSCYCGALGEAAGAVRVSGAS